MIILALPFSIVIAVFFFSWAGHWSLWFLSALALLFAAYFTRYSRQCGIAKGLMVVGFLLLGSQWGMMAKHSVAPLELMAGDPLYLTGKVVDVPQRFFQQTQYKVRLVCLGYSDSSCDAFNSKKRIWPSYVQVSLDTQTHIAPVPGQIWRWQVVHKPYTRSKNVSGFQLFTWLLSNHLVGRFKLVSETRGQLLNQDSFHIDRLRQRLHEYFVTQMDQIGEANPSIFPVLLALASGDRSLMSDLHWQVFNRTGTTHLVAISGLHVGLVAGWCMWLFGFLFRRWHWFTQRRAAGHGAAFFAVITCTGYGALAGFGLPTQRAILMLVIYVCLLWLGKAHQLWLGLMLAFASVLVWDPVACLSIGFWLSFAAVACILWVVGGAPLKRSWSVGWLRVQMGLFFALAPLLLWKMQVLSLSAPIANAVAIPVVAFILVPLTLVWCVLWALFGDVCNLLLQPAIVTGEMLLQCLQWISEWRGGQYQIGVKPWWAMVLSCVGIFWLLTPGLPARILSIFLLLPMLLPSYPARGVALSGLSSARLVVSKPHQILAISESSWPELIPHWQDHWFRREGIRISPEIMVQNSHLLWQAKGFTLVIYSIVRGPLGQWLVQSANYIDLCADTDELSPELGIQVFKDRRYPRHCAVAYSTENTNESWLLWPTSSIRSQQTLLDQLPVFENATVAVAVKENQKVDARLVSWLKQSSGHLVALKPLPSSLVSELESASVAFSNLEAGSWQFVAFDNEAGPPQK